MRLVSGPQGPRVVLDGRPVTVLSSGNYLGLADHPRVREAAADAALRWGASAGAARPGVRDDAHPPPPRGPARRLPAHRGRAARGLRLPGRARGDHRARRAGHDDPRRRARLPGDRGRVPPRAGRHGRVPPRRRTSRSRGSCGGAAGRGPQPALVVTEAVFARDGDVAPLEELCEAVRRGGARLIVDESHAIGCLGPGGRGALAEAGLDGEADLVVSSLGTALGSYGGVIAGDAVAPARGRRGRDRPRPLLRAVAAGERRGARRARPRRRRARRVAKLQANAGILRDALARDRPGGHRLRHARHGRRGRRAGETPRASATSRSRRASLVEAIAPPALAEGGARVRMAVMASHTRAELAGAAARAGSRAGSRRPPRRRRARPGRRQDGRRLRPGRPGWRRRG